MSLRFPRLCLFTCLAALTRAQTPATIPPAATTPAAVTAPPAEPFPPLINKADDELVGPIKMPDADIDTMLGALEIYTGRSILRPAGLPTATYNLKIDRPIPKSEAILAIETVLQLNGIGVVPLGDKLLKVVALQFVRTEAPEMILGSTLALPASGRIATKIFMLDFLRVTEFIPQIQQSMLSLNIGAGVVQLPNANAALITDTVSNLQRVEMLLKEVDRPITASLKPKFYTLRNGAKASDVVAKIRSTITNQLQLQLGAATTYASDDRTNQIILIADPRQHPFFDELIAKLDVKADPNTQNEVIPLKHATSKEVAQLLMNLVQGQNAATQKANPQSVRPGQGAQTGTQPSGQPIPGGVQPNVATSVMSTLNTSTDGTSRSNEFSNLVSIQSDDRSNAIVVSGTADDLRLIKDLIAKLDVLLAQVRIEVIIAEVTLSDTDRSGISALNLTVATDTAATGGSRGTHITDFAGTLAGWSISSGVVNPLSFAAALSDAGNKSNLKILQNPTIVTTHAKEGRVIVGQEVPYISNATSNTATTGTTATTGVVNQSVSFKDINLDLKVTPLIGEDGSIQLTIDQLIQDQIGSITVNGTPTPIIGTRHATSFINVFDNQMIVLGGLQRTTLTTTRSKLGFFYEIPLLSHLLGDRSNKTERTELLLFIRPHVLRPEEGSFDTNKTIQTLSNKEQINDYLKDPSKTPKQGLSERYIK